MKVYLTSERSLVQTEEEAIALVLCQEGVKKDDRKHVELPVINEE